MTNEKIIRIDPVTRLEGHGTLTIKLGPSNKVKDIQFNVNSTRFFEKFLEGRPMEEAPRIESLHGSAAYAQSHTILLH
jgi:F420-non-reducing hydrogenase large subunit